MTKAEYDKIMQYIYESGRVDSDDDNSQEIEFHFEAKQRGFTDAQIAEALRKFN